MTGLTKKQFVEEKKAFFNEANKRLAKVTETLLPNKTKKYWLENVEYKDMVIHKISDNQTIWEWIEWKKNAPNRA